MAQNYPIMKSGDASTTHSRVAELTDRVFSLGSLAWLSRRRLELSSHGSYYRKSVTRCCCVLCSTSVGESWLAAEADNLSIQSKHFGSVWTIRDRFPNPRQTRSAPMRDEEIS